MPARIRASSAVKFRTGARRHLNEQNPSSPSSAEMKENGRCAGGEGSEASEACFRGEEGREFPRWNRGKIRGNARRGEGQRRGRKLSIWPSKRVDEVSEGASERGNAQVRRSAMVVCHVTELRGVQRSWVKLEVKLEFKCEVLLNPHNQRIVSVGSQWCSQSHSMATVKGVKRSKVDFRGGARRRGESGNPRGVRRKVKSK